MKLKNVFSIGGAALMAVLLLAAQVSAQSAAERHMGHVATAWNDTPDGMGLLPAAQAEAEVAAQHAQLAANSDDLDAIKRHTAHVVHALDPSAVDGGPGKGYGLIKAAQGAAQHIGMAGTSDGATDGMATHSAHVKASAENVAMWGQAILEKAELIMSATDASAAAEMAHEIHAMTTAILEGTDANGDGRVSWGEGEGGLQQAATHLGLMAR